MPSQCKASAVFFVLIFHTIGYSQTVAVPTAEVPLVVRADARTVQIFGIIRPVRFNAAEGNQARYHVLVWEGGNSPDALIVTPADDLAFHDALLQIGAKPGDNLDMAAWTKRHDPHDAASHKRVTGSEIQISIAWKDNPAGVPIEEIFHRPLIPTPQSLIQWRFGGNRDRWFNRIPFAPRPGCLMCLYSCPSGKISNGKASIHDYTAAPTRFEANSALLPPDGTPVVVTFRLLS